MYLFYWTTANGQFSFSPSKKEEDSHQLYKDAAENRKNWIEEGLKQGNNSRFRRKIESIMKVNIETEETTLIWKL